MQNREDNVQPK